MTVSLDNGVTISGVQVRALVRTTLTASHHSASFLVTGSKSPIAFLIFAGEMLRAVTPDGSPMSKDTVERLCPGAWDVARTAGDTA